MLQNQTETLATQANYLATEICDANRVFKYNPFNGELWSAIFNMQRRETFLSTTKVQLTSLKQDVSLFIFKEELLWEKKSIKYKQIQN